MAFKAGLTIEESLIVRIEIFPCRQRTRVSQQKSFVVELGRSLVGFSGYDPGNWQEPAFAGLVRNVETLALQRGLMRWEPS
ncbi:MAG: hypothetical protein ACYDHG_17760 [Desulfomonilaceae bacterium]